MIWLLSFSQNLIIFIFISMTWLLEDAVQTEQRHLKNDGDDGDGDDDDDGVGGDYDGDVDDDADDN